MIDTSCDYMDIDLFRDGALKTAQKLRLKALRGNNVEGGFDFPSTSGLSKMDKITSNLHVDFTQTFEQSELANDAFWSYHSNEAPPNLKKEPVPSDTRSPFIFPEGTREAPGLFGKALRNYSEAKAIMDIYAQDTTYYTDAFAQVWGLTEEQKDLLNNTIPMPQSTGAAMWGGLGRKLQPMCFAYGPAQAAMKVTFHNANRTTFGEDALLDWSRIKEIARAICGQLAVDDELAFKKIKRLDYAIDQRKVPKAPKIVKLQPFYIDDDFKHNLKNFLSAAFTYYEKSRQIRKVFLKDEAYETLKFENINMVPSLDALLVTNEEVRMGIDWAKMFDKKDSGPFLEKQHKSNVKEQLRELPLTKVLLHLLKHHTRKKKDHLIRFHIYKKLRDEYFREVGSLEKRKEIIFWINFCIPDEILHMINTLGNIVNGGMGQVWLRRLKERWDIPNGVFQAVDLCAVKIAFCRQERCIERILHDIDVVIYDVEHEYAPVISKFNIQFMLNAGSVQLGLELLFTKHKKMWAKHYERTALQELKRNDGKPNFAVIRNQCLYYAFRQAQFTVNENGEVKVNTDRLAECMNHAMIDYLRKRKKLRIEDENFGGFTYTQIASGDADIFITNAVGVAPDYKFSLMMDNVRVSLEYFAKDIKELVGKLVVGENIDDYEQRIEEGEDKNEQAVEESSNGNVGEMAETQDGVSDHDNEAGNTLGFDDDFDDDEEVKQDNTFDLEEELLTDFPLLETSDHTILIAEFGERVTLETYRMVQKRAFELLQRKTGVQKVGLQEGVDLI